MNLFLCANYVNYENAISIAANNGYSIILFNPNRINKKIKVTKKFLLLPLNRITCYILYVLQFLYKLDIYCPHKKFNKLFFKRFNSLNLICDGLDYYRDTPKNISFDEIESFTNAYVDKRQLKRPHWLRSMKLIDIDIIEESIYGVGKELGYFFKNFECVIVESPGIHFHNKDNKRCIFIRHPASTKRGLFPDNYVDSTKLRSNIEVLIYNTRNIEVYLGETYTVISLLRMNFESRKLFVYIPILSKSNLTCFVEELEDYGVKIEYVH